MGRLLSCIAAAARRDCRGSHWVGAWSASPSSPTGQIFINQSLRLIVNPTIGAKIARVRLSNRYGTAPVTFTSAFIARRRAGAGLVPGTSRRLRFRGKRSVIVPARREVVSDAVMFGYRAFQSLAVSLHVYASTSPASEHFASSQTSYATPPASGDRAGEDAGTAFTGVLPSWPFLTDVEVRASKRVGAVVHLGASTTDGVGSTPDRNTRYPDYLARRVRAAGNRSMAHQNAGISGNRLRDDDPRVFSGPSMLQRLGGDVIDQAGVTHVLVQAGINDVGLPPPPRLATAQHVIDGLALLTRRLQRAGLKVILTTQTPSRGYPFGLHGDPEAIFKREVINRWTRNQRISDGVADFNRVLRDQKDPGALRPAYDSIDGQHPNDAGYRAMARAIPLSLLRLPRCRR